MLVRDDRKDRVGGLRDRKKARRDNRLVAALRDHRGISDAIEPDRVARRTIRDRNSGEFWHIDLKDLVQPVDIPALQELILDPRCDLNRLIFLRRGQAAGQKPIRTAMQRPQASERAPTFSSPERIGMIIMLSHELELSMNLRPMPGHSRIGLPRNSAFVAGRSSRALSARRLNSLFWAE